MLAHISDKELIETYWNLKAYTQEMLDDYSAELIET